MLKATTSTASIGEAHYLFGGSVDDFLPRPPSRPVYPPRAPFCADNR
ncbi:MAG: hypothetical protein GY859_00545 [Desulfobacterales bacterium]|nr:hypothetical protein [Desulfobacterales bacterium]